MDRRTALCCSVVLLLRWDMTLAFLSGDGFHRTSFRIKSSKLPVVAPFPLMRLSSSSSSALHMAYKLWERLDIEEDEEPNWYLLNCVATNELDLLRQCRTVCDGMEDVVKFVVPIEQLTRSHGASKMVTETKVKYPGYVFAKLRLSPVAYEAIQDLDLCRSWMGTVNHKGYKKLPPIPLALNEDEVESFGLEDVPVEVDGDDDFAELSADPNAVIVDSDEDDEDDDDNSYEDPMYKNIDKKALKKFKGLKVEDMVKVTAQGKFFNEDGIVRRLKDGKIFVRFYTYGTMFEEWMDPGDVRKLSSEEVIKGLSGPSQPITQRDFDGPPEDMFDGRRPGMGGSAGTNVKSVFGGSSEQRNRRQDRMADRFRGTNLDSQRRDADKNWNWYKEQQQEQQRQPREERPSYTDNEWKMQPGSNPRDAAWAEGDDDSQWGRKSDRRPPVPPPTRREVRKPANKIVNRQTAAAIDGRDDWSAFVSPSSVSSNRSGESRQKDNASSGSSTSSSNNNAADDFFASLMNDLNKDLGSTTPGRQQQPTRQNPSRNDKSSDDDFFASLMTELAKELPTDDVVETDKNTQLRATTTIRDDSSASRASQDDDFFAFLGADLEKALGDISDNASNEPEIALSNKSAPSALRDNNDFVANEPEIALPKKSAPSPAGQANAIVDRPAQPANSAGELNKKTVPALKEMLRERGLKVGGNKSELVERLLQS